MSSIYSSCIPNFCLYDGWQSDVPAELREEILRWLVLQPSIIRTQPQFQYGEEPPAYEQIIALRPLQLRALSDRHRTLALGLPRDRTLVPEEPDLRLDDQWVRFSPVLDILQLVELCVPAEHVISVVPGEVRLFPARRLLSTCSSLAPHPSHRSEVGLGHIPGLKDAQEPYSGLWRRNYRGESVGDPLPLDYFASVSEATFTYAIADVSLFLPPLISGDVPSPFFEFECHTGQVNSLCRHCRVWFRTLERSDVVDMLLASRRDWSTLKGTMLVLMPSHFRLPSLEDEPVMAVRLRLVRPDDRCPMTPERERQGHWTRLEEFSNRRPQNNRQDIARTHYGRIRKSFEAQDRHQCPPWVFFKTADFQPLRPA